MVDALLLVLLVLWLILFFGFMVWRCFLFFGLMVVALLPSFCRHGC